MNWHSPDPKAPQGSARKVAQLSALLDPLHRDDETWSIGLRARSDGDGQEVDPEAEWRFIGSGQTKIAFLHVPSQTVYKTFGVDPGSYHEANLNYELIGRDRFPDIDGAVHTPTSGYFYEDRGYICQPYYASIKADMSQMPEHIWQTVHQHGFSDTTYNFTITDSGIEFFDAFSDCFDDDEFGVLVDALNTEPWPTTTGFVSLDKLVHFN